MHTFEYDTVLCETEGHVATVRINRPDKLNALNLQVLDDLGRAFQQLESDGKTRCAILTGAGDRAFAAGADIREMAKMTTNEARSFSRRGHSLGSDLERLAFPVIAAVNGFALGGGCELALACDFIYASDTAKFGQPEVNLGVIPGFGGTQRLARRVGIALARELAYTGRMIDAHEALRIGLANAVFPKDALAARALETAETIATKGPLAVEAAKRVLLEGEDQPLLAANDLEIWAFSRCFATEDQREGMGAFLEKRKPQFTGK
ncbi:MAG: enoyl-CoA hydratase/isomerase family protein [Deltaproteobacteria bacterium]|nr:enoyl-CoA hydratase/isomerase family protein [Deltaproteobacteria bacterium]